MKVQQLNDALLENGFEEQKVDTGFLYKKTVNHIELVCYIEPQIDIAFTTIYNWDDNSVKGVYKASLIELSRGNASASLFFKKAMADMPRFIGEEINVHADVEDVINRTFGTE